MKPDMSAATPRLGRSAPLVLLALLFGCAAPVAGPVRTAKLVCAADGDGFAPVRVADRGIGGTGAPVRTADRGIGGTGAPIGVKGTITGFASICVNGLEIAYAASDTVDVDGVARAATELRVGQVVNLRADAGTGGLAAADMTVRHAVSGQIEAVENGGLNLMIAGQAVLLGVGSLGVDRLRPGQWAEVSGLRDPAGYIVAARVDLREPGPVIISGRLAGRPGALRIGGARLQGSVPASLLNSAVSVSGDYADGVLSVRTVIDAGATLPDRQPRMMYVEAFARATQAPGGAPALQIGDDLTAAIAPGFGAVPRSSTLLVLALEVSETGELTALAQYGGQVGSGAAVQATPTAVTLAPHAATTTAIGISTTSNASAGAKAATSAATSSKAAAAATTSKGSSTTGSGAASNSGAGANSANAGGKGGASPTKK